MAVDVVMPQMGVSVSEGTISRWMKQVGDRIEADETIVEISTDKVDTEVPSPGAGVITDILVPEGETVPVGTRIAVIDGAAAGNGAAASAASAPSVPAPSPEAPGTAPESPAAAATATQASGTTEAAPAAAEPAPHFGPGTSDGGYEAPAGGDDGGTNGAEGGAGRSFMSPVVARMVAEHGLDIARIPGTGRGGRVTKKDVEAFLASGAAEAPAVASAPSPPPTVAAPAPAAVAPPEPTAAVQAGALEEVYRFNTIRKAISRHMRESIETAAQVTSVIEVDMTRVANLRRELKPQYQKTYGVSLSYLPFIIRAVLDGIARWPWMNAEIQGDQAIIKRYVNLGIAVAVDDAKGLLVPVIKNAEDKSLVGLSRSIVDLADRARKKQLAPDEMTGATFTITNPGVFGALIGTPIIPTKTVAIIDVEAIVKRPVVVTDEHGNDSIAIRQMMYLPISYDHRLIDGAYSAQFMQVVKRNLETWGAEHYGA